MKIIKFFHLACIAVSIFLLAGHFDMVGAEERGRHKRYPPKEFERELKKGKVGRFQAVSLERGGAFIVDTKEGHLWVWAKGSTGTVLRYEGQVFPGSHMGDVIDSVFETKEEGK